MKKYDPNNFVIDHVFGALDKLYKKRAKKEKEKEEAEKLENITNEKISDEPNGNEYYTIEINV